MAKEPLQEKELQIKKTARRRLVGAIAMVVILLVVLPFMLKDHATDSAQDAVKITIVSDASTNEPIPELNDKEVGFESNVNPTEVTGYTQPTVLPSQQDANAPTSDSKTHIALPKVTPPPVNTAAVTPPLVATSQTVDEHSKLSQVLDVSNSSPATTSPQSQQVQETQKPSTDVKVNNDKPASNQQLPAKQNVANPNKTQENKTQQNNAQPSKSAESNAQKAVEAKQADEAKAKEKEKADLAKKQAEEASAKLKLEKEKAEKKKAEALKAEKIKAEQLAKEKAQAEKAKQAKEDKAKEDKAKVASNATSGKFFVQYGVFSDPKNAEKLQSSLKQKGFVAETENIDATSKKVRLRSKVYSTKEEALKALKSVQGAGFSAIVTGK